MPPLADTFMQVVDSLPDDWTDLELDLRIFDERRYVDAAVRMVTCNAQPYSKADWHWRLLVAHRFGHAAGDIIGVIVGAGEQRQHAHLQHAFLELDLQWLGHDTLLAHDTLYCKLVKMPLSAGKTAQTNP